MDEQGQRAVVGTEDLVANDVVADVGVDEPLRGHEVVEPPADVLGPTVHHVRPEGVGLLLVGVEVPERVHEVVLLQQR